MQAARLTQDYSGFFRQPVVSRKDGGADKSQTNRSRPSVLPAERVVEGELLRNRTSGADNSLEQFLQRERLSESAANAADGAAGNRTAQTAINAYLDNAAMASGKGGGHTHSIDYYA